jgi:hypothetical protein
MKQYNVALRWFVNASLGIPGHPWASLDKAMRLARGLLQEAYSGQGKVRGTSAMASTPVVQSRRGDRVSAPSI